MYVGTKCGPLCMLITRTIHNDLYRVVLLLDSGLHDLANLTKATDGELLERTGQTSCSIFPLMHFPPPSPKKNGKKPALEKGKKGGVWTLHNNNDVESRRRRLAV